MDLETNYYDKDSIFPNKIESKRLKLKGPIDKYYSFRDFYEVFFENDGAKEMAKYNLYSHNKNIKEAHDEIWNYMIDGWEQKTLVIILLNLKKII